jgi:hypothetical protein
MWNIILSKILVTDEIKYLIRLDNLPLKTLHKGRGLRRVKNLYPYPYPSVPLGSRVRVCNTPLKPYTHSF